MQQAKSCYGQERGVVVVVVVKEGARQIVVRVRVRCMQEAATCQLVRKG